MLLQAFVGDDTWMQLFPHQFHTAIPYSSFNVMDLHTVDDGVWQVSFTTQTVSIDGLLTHAAALHIHAMRLSRAAQHDKMSRHGHSEGHVFQAALCTRQAESNDAS